MTVPGADGAAGEGESASLVAVRISLEDGAALAQAASAGARLDCDIRTRSLLGFTGL